MSQIEDDPIDPLISKALAGLPEDFNRFARIYQREIRPQLQLREGERTKAADTAKKSLIGAGALAVLGGGVGFLALNMPAIGIAALVGAAIIGAIGYAPMQRLSGQAKSMMVVPIAQSFNCSFTDKPGRVSSIHDLRRVGLIPNYDRDHFEDMLVGTRDGVSFEFFEARLKERRTTTTKNGTRTTYVTVFDGQCLRFDFHKRFFGETLVTRDAGWFNSFGGRSGMDRARLEDPEFERAFEVYTTDQVEARFLLTPDMMQSLMDLERTFKGKKLRCAFSGTEMFVAVEGGNLFEPGSLFTPLDNPERIRELLMDFAAVFDIIDKASAGRRREQAERGDADPADPAGQGTIL